MKIVCTKSELLKGISVVSGATSQKTTLALLSNLLFEAKDDILTLAATDLEIAVKTQIKAQVIKEGGITLPGRLISDIVKKTPQDEIEISADEQSKVVVKSGRTKYSIVGIPRDEFPAVVDFNTEKKLTIKSDILREMITRTKFAVSTDETRYVLNGIYFAVAAGTVTMVATDGKRLTFVARKNVVDKKFTANLIIPAKALEEALKIIAGSAGTEVEIGLFDNQIGFRMNDTVLKSRLIDGHFPNYEQVIPKEKERKGSFKAKTQELLAATERVALVASGKAVPVKYSLSDGKLALYVMEQGKGEGNDEISVEYSGEKFEAAYNPAYVMDMLKIESSPDVLFEFSAPISPAILRPAADPDYQYIIMPMRLD
jgi:DNA polymerase-3 subunit beta